MAFKNFVRYEGYTRAGVKAHILHVLRIRSQAPGASSVGAGEIGRAHV